MKKIILFFMLFNYLPFLYAMDIFERNIKSIRKINPQSKKNLPLLTLKMNIENRITSAELEQSVKILLISSKLNIKQLIYLNQLINYHADLNYKKSHFVKHIKNDNNS